MFPYTIDFSINNRSIDMLMSSTDLLVTNFTYDPYLCTDFEELKQRVIHCLITENGELPHRPTWGIGVRAMQNAPSNDASFSAFASKVRKQLLQPEWFPEIVSVDEISLPVTGNLVNISITITTYIYGEITLNV